MSLLVPFSGITAFPENDNEQDVDSLAKALERMLLKNKGKRRAKKELKKQLEAAEKKLGSQGTIMWLCKRNSKTLLE